MKYITEKQIESLHIEPATCIKWVTESFSIKEKSQLPAKMSVHPAGNDFFTTMPCLLPPEYKRFGVKVVSRIAGKDPALKSDLMLFDSETGDLVALMDSNWITNMRTGAVASLAVKTFRSSHSHIYSLIGLGHTAYATMLCLLDSSPDESFQVLLFRYKNQAEKFITRFESYKNVTFTIVNTIEELVANADVLISCITDAPGLLVEDNSLFKEGVLVIPVHTRGFQNCDLFFDKIFADDTAHVRGFKNFDKFRYFDEISNVLTGKNCGRASGRERILSYNIGLGLHDVYFATKIYDLLFPAFQ